MLTREERHERIDRIRNFPAELEAVVRPLTAEELNTRFIEGEWSVAQNVHHLVDSHINAYTRFKLLYTEDNPTIKGYDQDLWAELVDSLEAPIEVSISILKGLHLRWAMFLDSLKDEDWSRPGIHPESGKITIESLLITYSDHGIGHIDQINRTLAAGRKTGS